MSAYSSLRHLRSVVGDAQLRESGGPDGVLRQVTITYLPPTSARPVENRFDYMNMSDVTFTLAALASRLGTRAPARAVADALAEARSLQEDFTEAQIDVAVEDALGAWRRLLPGRIRRRIIARLMLPLGHEVTDLTVELGQMRARLDHAMESDRRAQAPVGGPQLMCNGGGLSCSATTPLADMAEGWTRDEHGARCPRHNRKENT